MSSKNKSEVWKFFSRKGNGLCICNLCSRTYKTGGGTTNLKNHLMYKHALCLKSLNNLSEASTSSSKKTKTQGDGELLLDNRKINNANEQKKQLDVKDGDMIDNQIFNYDCEDSSDYTSDLEIVSGSSVSVSSVASSQTNIKAHTFPYYSQPTIKKVFKEQRSYETGGAKESAITEALVYMICKDNLPLGCTEKEGMKKFLKTVAPLYKPCSRKKITQLVEQKYATMQTIVSRTLAELNTIAITTDIATVMNATRSFIVLTVHYIDEKMSCLCSINLGVKNLTPHHTAVNICEDLTEMLEYWNIKKSQVISATTDNGANIVAGIKLLFSDNNIIHVNCFAHNINLVVSKALGTVTDLVQIIDKVKVIVAYFKHSNVAQDDLRNEQKKDGKSDGTYLYLKQEVPTRWNSTFYCLERFLLLSGYVGKILLSPDHKKAPPMLTGFELAIISECLDVLKPFESATKDISGDSYVSGSIVIPLVNCINTALRKITVSNQLSQILKTELEKQIEKRLIPLEKNILLAAASMIDPRFKKLHFCSPINAANAISYLKQQIAQELKLEDHRTGNFDDEVLASNGNNANDIWQVHDQAVANARRSMDVENVQSGSSMTSLPTELKLYLDQPLVSRNIDPIHYWKENQSAFPATSKVALKHLTVLGASVPSERLVSLLNLVCTDHRSRLTPGHTNHLVFLGSLNEEYWKM